MNFVEACKEIEANGGIFENEIGTRLSTEGDGYVGITLRGPPNTTSNKIFSSKTILNNCQGEFKKLVDWSKEAVDTKVWVRTRHGCEWLKRHFAFWENGVVYCFLDGGTSWTEKGTTDWKYCKLAKEGE